MKSDNQVHILGIIGEHSYPMSNNIQMAAPQYHHFTFEMCDDIELLAAMVKAEKGELSDAGATYKELMRQKQEMPRGLKPKIVYIDANLAITGAIENFGREKFRDFFSSFCQARNSITETVYERKWQQVLDLFPEAQFYLRCQLYPHREAWVLAFTHQSFNYEVVSIIEQHLMRESQFVRFNEINGELPRIMHATYRDHYFMAIDKACTKFLIPAIQKL
ncbi:9410_t:CDS:2 [Cetraspora pellucida]|uniref:9410_t:CDS:1 n=1 Tax=Cetraspora pellucida TaxID=1433469 RepID=A0A9N9DHK6_9GLOM|nr:9410_t:CDS:2 [Cetraspora pellucida]